MNLKNVKVSIITPVYNCEDFIQETIDSILCQNYNNIEYIIIDDGSNDKTKSILDKYKKYANIIHQKNMGETLTVNKGYRLATGDMIGVINADDPLISKYAISTMIDYSKYSNCLAVYPDWISIDDKGKTIRKIKLPLYTIENMMTHFSVSLGPGMLIKREGLDIVGYRDDSLIYTGDLDIAFKLALVGNFCHVSEFLATHRVHKKAASSTGKGYIMAHELERLATITLNNPLCPQKIVNKRKDILQRVYECALNYTGNDMKAQLLYNLKLHNLIAKYSHQ